MRPEKGQKGEKTPGSGRKIGTPNKSTLSDYEELKRISSDSGVDPFKRLIDYILGRVPGCTAEQSFKATVEACQYLYYKRKVIDSNLNMEGESGIKIIIEDYSKKQGENK